MMKLSFVRLVPVLVTVVLLGVNIASPVHAATTLTEDIVDLTIVPDAVCGNGEPANMQVTTVSDGGGTSTKWLVYLEGGGSCKDDTSCQDRWVNEGHNMRPATSYPAGGRINLTQGNSAPFDGYNTVQVHYCSSDGWIGAHEGSVDGNGDPAVYNGTDDLVTGSPSAGEYGVHFQGKRILQATFLELQNLHNIQSSATEIVLAGQSAGSAGVQAHLQSVDNYFGVGVNVRGLMLDTWIPYLPRAGTESQVRTNLANIGISQTVIDDLLAYATFDVGDSLDAMYSLANVWGALNDVQTTGWPGPATCFDALVVLPEVIADPELLMLCSLPDFVFNPVYTDGVTPFISSEVLILRNFYDIAVGLAAFNLFPDNENVSAQDFADTLVDVLKLQALSELKNYLDLDGRKDILVDTSSELAVALYTIIMPVLQDSLEGAADAANVTVFAPALEMSTVNCSVFNPGGCNYAEAARRGIPTHGVLDSHVGSGCANGYAALFGQLPATVVCVNTFTSQIIQPQGSNVLGAAHSVKQYLDGWAIRNSTYDYSLVKDTKIP